MMSRNDAKYPRQKAGSEGSLRKMRQNIMSDISSGHHISEFMQLFFHGNIFP